MDTHVKVLGAIQVAFGAMGVMLALPIIGLIMIHFGTVVGLYCLWVLFSKHTERLFMAAAPQA